MRSLAAIDLNLLVALEALLAERHVTRAGGRIGLSQPAMSKALGRLRVHFGDPLLVRGSGGMEATAKGLALLGPVRGALSQAQSVFEHCPRGFDPRAARRAVTIASSDLTELLVLPAFLARLRRDAPGLDLRVRGVDRIDVVAALDAGEVELALIPLAEHSGDLRAVPLFRDRLVCAVARRHPALRGKKLTLSQYLRLTHVVVSVEWRGASSVDAALVARGVERRIGLVLQHFVPVPFAVGASDMIATLPERLARRLATAAGIALLRPPLALDDFTMHVAWHRRSDHDPLLDWLRARLIHAAARSTPPGAARSFTS